MPTPSRWRTQPRAVASTHWTSWIPSGRAGPNAEELTGTPHEDRTLGDAVVADLTITGDEITAIEVTDVQERPVIGISWKKDSIGTDYQASLRHSSATAPRPSSCPR